MADPTKQAFMEQAESFDLVPVTRRVLSDHLTPVLAYRRLVSGDQRTDASFLLESVEVGGTVGRHSVVAARPVLELTARRHEVTLLDHRDDSSRVEHCGDPLEMIASQTSGLRIAAGSDRVFRGGWAGWLAYDSVRWLEAEAVSEEAAPTDDRNLPDMHFGLYDTVVVFDSGWTRCLPCSPRTRSRCRPAASHSMQQGPADCRGRREPAARTSRHRLSGASSTSRLAMSFRWSRRSVSSE
jgi:anthranilate synthase component 1